MYTGVVFVRNSLLSIISRLLLSEVGTHFESWKSGQMFLCTVVMVFESHVLYSMAFDTSRLLEDNDVTTVRTEVVTTVVFQFVFLKSRVTVETQLY